MENVKALLEKNQIHVKDNDIKKWETYSYSLIEQTVEEIKDQKMKYPAAYITKVLENKHELFLHTRQHVHAENDNIAEILLQFIKRWEKHGIMPDWFIKDKLEKHLKSEFSLTEIENIWEDNKDYLIEVINK
ncbi:hypothetical protein JCM21714_4250 [Gracilibacillus boraciitolerans JCM 21714]|uniref:Uncharacterized protein n=1 Tax=Gracilibacillus boraciitolerans JCM 21714 TaxID=1298598 RepID=W4VQJ8_9BACI|nr:hypothetical protein [Gracilibacillus boraciitolerans]GAE95044.1 hypothetical protein JCM21714_4250 [Gracilibacillus boraciitolerans JCM 21714]